MRKKSHESECMGLCPKCHRIRRLTKHHVKPLRFGRNNGVVVHLCWECHREIDELLPQEHQFSFDEYVSITACFLRGENIMVKGG